MRGQLDIFGVLSEPQATEDSGPRQGSQVLCDPETCVSTQGNCGFLGTFVFYFSPLIMRKSDYYSATLTVKQVWPSLTPAQFMVGLQPCLTESLLLVLVLLDSELLP